MRWEDLIRLENLCNGSPLAAIAFCCRSTKPCPFRDKALELLGIGVEEYEAVKEEMKIEAKGTCYGNLAYCCSLNTQCEARDRVLNELEMTPAEYLQYKYRILKKLIPKELEEEAFTRKVVFLFAFEMVNLDDPDTGYRGLALGNPELTDNLLIIDVKPMSPSMSEDVKNEVRKNKFLSVRVSSEKYEQLVNLASVRDCNVSDVVREAIALYLNLYGKTVEVPVAREGKVYKG